MSEFVKIYKKIADAALSWGVSNVPINIEGESPFRDDEHHRKFISACHRGYEKAQDAILKVINDNNSDDSISYNIRQYRELLLRKIIDAIAFTLFQMQLHVARRLCFHDVPPKLNHRVLVEAKDFVDRLNRESRQTFALMADLTTFIHVTDIIRIDFRNKVPEVSFIELKSGKINAMLLSQLANYKPTQDSLMEVKNDPLIDNKYLPQAERILRQRIRLEQIDQVLKSDEGMDIKGYPIKLSKDMKMVDTYDDLINKLCDEAMVNGVASGVEQYCLHIGVGYSENEQKATNNAILGAKYSIYKCNEENTDKLGEIRSELLEIISEDELLQVYDILRANLTTVPCRPFIIWGINPDHLLNMVDQKMKVIVAFDIVSFIFLGRSNGFDVGLSTRKKATQFAQQCGAKCVPRWGGRGIRCATNRGDIIMGSGMFSRFICNLESPLQFFHYNQSFP